MHRRVVMGLIGSTGVGLVGCVADEPSPGSGPTNGNSTVTTPAVDIAKEEFEVLTTECGSGNETAKISHASTGSRSGRVIVDGIISGNNSCYSARLGLVAYDDTELRITVNSYLPEAHQDTLCAECIVDVEYRTVLRYDGLSGFAVTVLHNNEHVTTSGRFTG
jgi:hypothetical protein